MELSSHWPDHEVAIDGVNSEWENSSTYIEDEKVLVGVMNDENFLYISLIADDPVVRRQMLGQGFMVWFDPVGGRKKSFGIQYPLGLQEMGVPMKDFTGPDVDNTKRREIVEQSLTELIIRGSDTEDWDRMIIKDAAGIEIKISDTAPFVYELRVPLRISQDHPYAVGVKQESVGIGFEMQKFDREKMIAGRRGGMHGGPMGHPGGRPEMTKPLKLWVKVRLAERNELKQD